MTFEHAISSEPYHAAHREPFAPASLFALIVFLVPPFLVAFVSSQWTVTDAGSWYDTLEKPSWTPPGYAFGIAWTLLYLAIGIAAWLVWLTGNRVYSVAIPLAVWLIQLVLNLGWTFAFFNQESIVSGIFVIAALWLAIAATIVAFLPKSRPAAALLIPYLAWVTYAAALNIEIWRLN